MLFLMDEDLDLMPAHIVHVWSVELKPLLPLYDAVKLILLIRMGA